MIEKVNPMHPDKIADRIAGAMVDLAYKKSDRPRIAVEVLIGHGICHIIAETSEHFDHDEVAEIVQRIANNPNVSTDYKEVPQDPELAKNQSEEIRCGDNGIFKGIRTNLEENRLSRIARRIYEQFGTDGKYILTDDRLIICQSGTADPKNKEWLEMYADKYSGAFETIINPLGDWTGGIDADTGATNRKLGSDMGRAVTGGGLHGKDLSKADVAVNIYAHIKAQDQCNGEKQIACAIGDDTVDGKAYEEIVAIAKKYIDDIGGFEKLAEWGLY